MAIRNNEERVGATPSSDAPISALDQGASNQQFAYVLPTEFVDIPSEGKFYPPEHPLHEQTSIEIRYMTAKEEDILTSQALLKKGVALDHLLRNILVDSTIKPESLLIGDKNALLISSRITGFGPDYSVAVTCAICGANDKETFDLETAQQVKQSELPEGVSHVKGTTFFTVLPKTQANVEFGLLTGADEKRVIQLSEMKRKKKLPETPFTDQLRLIISSVNGSSRPEHINQFIETLPTLDGRHLRKVFTSVSPDINLKCEYTCDVCAHTEEVDLPLTAEFFWPGQ
jgi:hypothetical protein|tara:strand:+ start:3276 stop:4133 length:858 start_codon:yes stop_codon:yes gene_type:complete